MEQGLAQIVAALIAGIATVVGAVVQQRNRRKRGTKRIDLGLVIIVVAGVVGTLLAIQGLVVAAGGAILISLVVGFVQQFRTWHPEQPRSGVITDVTWRVIAIIMVGVVGYAASPTRQQSPNPAEVTSDVRPPLNGWEEVGQIVCRDGIRDGYEIRTWDYPEWVKGDNGLYREIRIYNRESEPLLFRAREYKIPEEDRESFAPSVTRFVVDVIRPVQKAKLSFNLYVRGSADKPSFTALPVDAYFRGPFDLIDRATGAAKRRTIGATYTNDELPTLRGRYLQDILSRNKNYGVDSRMVEGPVTPTTNELERNAIIILSVAVPARHGRAPCVPYS